MSRITQTVLALTLALVATPTVHALQPIAPDDPAAYVAGNKAMDEHRWQDAVNDFDQVINAKAKKVDASLYWKAYSLNKLGNGPLALATCFQLRSQFTDSTWNKDCSALAIDAGQPFEIQIGPVGPLGPLSPDPAGKTNFRVFSRSFARSPNVDADGHRIPEDPNDEIKMLALNSLLNQDPARAIPLLRGVLTGESSPSIKHRALFVLAQSKNPEADSILHDALVGKMDPSLQRQAIQMMGVFQGKRANDTLAEVYRTTTDLKVKQAVISAFFVSQDAPRLVDLARNEKNLELKRTIVSQLAIMHDKAATDYMFELLK